MEFGILWPYIAWMILDQNEKVFLIQPDPVKDTLQRLCRDENFQPLPRQEIWQTTSALGETARETQQKPQVEVSEMKCLGKRHGAI